MIPGLPYSVVAALEPGRTSWTAVLDAVRLGPADDLTVVTAAQVRDLVGRLRTAGQYHDGDPDILVVLDAATTFIGWRSCSPTCRCSCSGGCARTGCCAVRRRPGARAAGPVGAETASRLLISAFVGAQARRPPAIADQHDRSLWPSDSPTSCSDAC
jgi:hypothetical protein